MSTVSEEDVVETMLTTVDNPYDPFTHFDEWYSYDTMKGYNSCGLLARIARTSHSLSDLDNAQELDSALSAILKENVYGVHKVVSRQKVS